ncbi:MAG TPA: hypothetical protein VH639_24415, partial [Bryobacteraceae bacterium]
ANGRSQPDGNRLQRMYRDLGLVLITTDNPMESGILEVWQRMRSGRLKVFASLPKFLEERRLYRRDERDQVVRQRDQLQDALRCLVSGLAQMRTKPKPPLPPPPPRTPWPNHLGSLGWMAN